MKPDPVRHQPRRGEIARWTPLTRKPAALPIELAEAEYMVRASGYLQTLDDFKNIVLKSQLIMACPVYLA